MHKKIGFTLVEIMLGLIITSAIAASLWQIFSASQKNAKEIIENSAINNDIELALLRISDDIRESNAINASFPAKIEPGNIDSLKTENNDNKIVFYKINYDFSKDPSANSNKVNYTKEEITYYVEKENDKAENNSYSLLRRSKVVGKDGKEMSGEETIYKILPNLNSCVFYQLNDKDQARTGNVYVQLKLANDDSPYSNTMTITVKERGSCPE